MGNESSTMAESFDPAKAWNLDQIAKEIKNGNIKKVIVMTGAGQSQAAGLPDFRSPGTGLYANLERLNLPYAEAVFELDFFKKNPEPFYALAHELYPGKYRPTLAHCFTRLLNDKGLLLKVFTQNIDCLDQAAGIPEEKIIEAHGSFAKQRCVECKTEYPDDEMSKHIAEKEVPYCKVPQCNGLVKPDIIFFGEPLPSKFHDNVQLAAQADLAIIEGSSLTVYPFAALPQLVARGSPRLLINKERVGNLGNYPEDVILLGDIEVGIRKFADALGWSAELDKIWQEKNPGKTLTKKEEIKKSRDEAFQEEMEKLTREVEQSLEIAAMHQKRTKRQLDEDSSKGLVSDSADAFSTTEDKTKAIEDDSHRELLP